MSIVHISGRIGRDGEVRKVGDTNVCNFSVAENIGFGDNKKVQWWSCAMWGTRGEKLAQYLTKGSAVTVCGEVSVREYTGKDGAAKFELTCRVLEVALQGGREGGERQEKPAGVPTKTGLSDGSDFEDDKTIPF